MLYNVEKLISCEISLFLRGKVIFMYCTKCGNQNDDNSSFCGICGVPLVNGNQNNSSYPNGNMNNQYNQNINPYYNQPQNGYYNQAPNNASKINSMALAGFIVSFFFGFLGLIFSLIGFHQTRVKGERGKGFAIAGIVIGCISVISMIWAIIFIATADPYELRHFYNDYYYDYGYGTAAVKELLSIFKI